MESDPSDTKSGLALLTKRSKNIKKYLPKIGPLATQRLARCLLRRQKKHGYPRVDTLRTIPAAKRFVSCEPLLEDISDIDLPASIRAIVGGESGPGAREFGLGWARSLRDACREAGVTPFVKQLGSRPVEDGSPFLIVNNAPDGKRDRDGRQMRNFPRDLQVQEVPGSEPPSSTPVAESEEVLTDLFRRAAASVITPSRHDDYRQRGLKAAETRRKNAAAKTAATAPQDGVSGEEFGRVLRWLYGYIENDAPGCSPISHRVLTPRSQE